MTNFDGLTSEIQRFIAQYIHSIEQLEILCLFANATDRTRSDSDVLRNIQSSPQSITNNLLHFVNTKILTAESNNTYRFSPENDEMAKIISALVRVYRERPVTVIETIYKTQDHTVRHFADAFKLKRRKT